MLYFKALAENGPKGPNAGKGNGISTVSGPGGRGLANSTATRKAARNRRDNAPATRTQLRNKGNAGRRRGL